MPQGPVMGTGSFWALLNNNLESNRSVSYRVYTSYLLGNVDLGVFVQVKGSSCRAVILKVLLKTKLF